MENPVQPNGYTSGFQSGIQKVVRLLQAIACRIFQAKVATTHQPSATSIFLARHDEIALAGKAAEMREKFIYQSMSLDECLVFYNLVVEACGFFPYDWEYKILLLGLEREPGRRDLAERLVAIRGYV